MEKTSFKLIEKWQKYYDVSVLQDKMDIDNILYCEGLHKPMCRGYLHWIAVFGYFFVFFVFYKKYCDIPIKKILFTIWIIINIITFKTSVILHTYDLNPIQEIRIQKLDHIMIYLNTLNHIIQYIFLYKFEDNSLNYTYFILFISLLITFLGIYLTVTKKKKDYHLFFSSIPIFMCIPLILKHFNRNQLLYFFSLWFCILFGLIAYNIKVPTSDIFGYHELFHLFTIVSAFFSVLLEKSLLENDYNK
jgi:hypothetical protein